MKERNKINKLLVVYLAAMSLGFASCDDYLKEKDLPRLTPEYYGTVAGNRKSGTV